MVVTVTAEFSLRGYWRTFRVRIACRPAMMMTRLTTTASTGRRMKTSVIFMEGSRSVVLRFWRLLEGGGQFVVDGHGLAVAELEHAGADDCFTFFEPFGDCHEITPLFSEADELL